MDVQELRGQGRWAEALEHMTDPFDRADLLNEQALFTGSAEAREAAGRELLRAEARLLQEKGRMLHARFLADRVEDPLELEHFERSLQLAAEAGDERLESWARFWVGIVLQVVRGDHDSSLSPSSRRRTKRPGPPETRSFSRTRSVISGSRGMSRAIVKTACMPSRSRSSSGAPTGSCQGSQPAS